MFLINLFVAAALQTGIPGSAVEPVRVEKTINTEWTFNYFPEEEMVKGVYEMPDFDDSKWSAIAVPHTWQTYETTHELHPYIRNAAAGDNPYWWNGWGWYRKHIVIGKEHEGKRVRFEFDGVQKYSEIYLNGKLLDTHKGGFTSFYVDATDAVRFGQDNVLVVAVNNTLNDKDRIPPMNAGNWVVYGGITRDVRIVVTDQVNIPFQGSYKHEGGTFIVTEKASKKEASLNMKTYVGNYGPQKTKVRLSTTIYDADGRDVYNAEETRSVESGEIAMFEQVVKKFQKPHLWSPDSPYLYTAVSDVIVGGRTVDRYFTEFGIRTVSWDYDIHRLILNGEPVHLHGINRHEEYVWLGQAFPKWIAQRDMEDMKSGLDINYMRTAHYPNDPSVYRFMDHNGICINEELPNIKNQDFNTKVQEQNCREMIRRDRNHPCIVIWSMGNETDKACDSRYADEEDKSRIITVRQPYNESYNPEFCRHTDKEMPVESYLRCTIKGWYDTDDRNLTPSDGQWAGTDYWQHQVSRNGKSPISEHNGTVWLYADHGADREYTDAPLKHVNPKGWVDSWRTPKYIYYLWQANFSRKPMVHIQPHFWRQRYVGTKKMITVDSNCRLVELYVNGKKIAQARPDVGNDFCVEFKDVEVCRGEIKAVATHQDGTVVEDRVVMAGEPAALTIVPSHDRMYASRDNIVEFKVDIVDAEGNHVIGANNTLHFQVEGPATLVGPDVYVSDRDKHEEFEGTMYIDVPVTNLVRATGQTGTVTFSVSSLGLKSASVTIPVLPAVQTEVEGISEPALSLEGREPVAINTSEANFIKAPAEMKDFAGEVTFPIARRSEFKSLMDAFIREQNPGLDTKCVEYPYLLSRFVAILESTANYTDERGYVVADDYNFLANQFNTSRAITKCIASLKVDDEYKKSLSKYFAKAIVRDGNDRNYISTCEILSNIPAGGKALKAEQKSDLKEMVLSVYPDYANLSKDSFKRALKFITAINPGVTYKSVRDKKTKVRTDYFTVSAGSVILIPDAVSVTKVKPIDKKL
ncbi:MAG: glycoside hydrolase family 2 TIM barrel-domain containing protein [Candidatus Cryptobacteroides sp.]